MIDHYIVWLDISVHNPHTVAVIQSLKEDLKLADVNKIWQMIKQIQCHSICDIIKSYISHL